jgi:hypothetical protein
VRPISNQDFHQIVKFVVENLGYVMVVNSVVLVVLWILRNLHLFTPILMYEVVFISGLGVLQILASRIHKGDGLSYRWGKYRAHWLDLRKFAKLKPEERSRYRQEGKVRITIGVTLLIAAIILHFSMV